MPVNRLTPHVRIAGRPKPARICAPASPGMAA
jgi:hypothetical protein